MAKGIGFGENTANTGGIGSEGNESEKEIACQGKAEGAVCQMTYTENGIQFVVSGKCKNSKCEDLKVI